MSASRWSHLAAGLMDLEEGHAACQQEKNLKTNGFKSLDNYYKLFRAFRLDKSNLPSESDEKTLAIQSGARDGVGEVPQSALQRIPLHTHLHAAKREAGGGHQEESGRCTASSPIQVRMHV